MVAARETYGHSKRQRFETIRATLQGDYDECLPHWRELSDFVLPRRPRFLASDRNRAHRRNSKINDGTATLASRSLAANMMAWNTNPSKPWVRLTIEDPELSELDSVKDWCYRVTSRMLTVFEGSQLYRALAELYRDMAVFGQSPMLIEEDAEDVIRATIFPIGSYMISRNARGVVDSVIRPFQMTVRQMIEEFWFREHGSFENIDWTKFSDTVRREWTEGNVETWVDVVHVITPNPDFKPGSPIAKYKRYSSCYYERGVRTPEGRYVDQSVSDRFLQESGYDWFPVLCPAWEVTAGDHFATDCPGMTGLADTRQLQKLESKRLTAISKIVSPPMIGPTSLINDRVSLIEGDITYSDTPSNVDGLRPIYQIEPNLRDLKETIAEKREAIQRAYFEDLFLAFAMDTRAQRATATEIEAKIQEKLLALGPVIQQLNKALLDPLIDIVFSIMLSQDLIPEPPEEIAGMALKVEYISLMAQAQKAAGSGNLIEFLIGLSQVAQLAPQAIDLLDPDEMVYSLAEARGLPPQVLRAKELVAQMRQAKAQLEAQQSSLSMIPAGAKAAKDLSETKMEGDTALNRIANKMASGALKLAA